MFNRSKKYAVLLLLNIIVLLVFYISQQQDQKDDPFDTEFVLEIMQKEDRLVNSVKELDYRLSKSSQELVNTQGQLEQTQLLVNRSEQKYQLCESEKQSILRASQEIKSSPQVNECTVESLQLKVASTRVALLEKQLAELQIDYTAVSESLISAKQIVEQAQNKDNKELELLRLQVAELNQAIKEPIAVSQHYMSARYCDKPKFDSLICVVEFLVRPTFSKPPVTRLGIKIIDNVGTTVTTGEFNSSQSQLYRISMGRGKELPAGKYTVFYSIDNQVIRSSDVVLSQ